MYLYESMGVAVLELDSYPDHNKKPDRAHQAEHQNHNLPVLSG